MPKQVRSLIRSVRRDPLRWGLALGAAAAYALAFVPPYASTDLAIVVLSAAPVLTASWLLGFWGGLAAALLSFPVNAALLTLTGHNGWAQLQDPDTLQGSLLVLILGVVVGGLRDIASQLRTEHEARRATEAAAQATDVRYRMVAETASDAILTLDAARRIIYLNPAAERVFGYARHELEGRAFDVLLARAARGFTSAEVHRYLAALPTGGRQRPLELLAQRKDGSRFDVEASFGATLEDETPIYTVIVRNVTERKELERALRDARNEALRASQAKSEFVSRMSHELRTPLNAILGFAQLVEADSLPADDRDSLTQIVKAGRHLLGLVDEVLDIARIEAGRLSLHLEQVELEDVAAEAWSLVRPRAMERGVTADLTALEGCPVVHADVQRLRQVLLNLFSNAVKYNREGGAVRVSCEIEDAAVRVEVADDGPGVAGEYVDRLFTPFDRLGAERSGIEGTGMGLSLSRTLMRAMDGDMGYNAERGTFHMTVPLAEAEADEVEATPATPPASHAAAVSDEVVALCAIADPVQLRLLERLLDRPGLRVEIAMQASTALELAERHAPALIVADARLPDMGGAELARALRAAAGTTGAAVVLLSVDADDGTERTLLDAGADLVMPLPLDVPRFLAAVATDAPVAAAVTSDDGIP